MSSPHKPLVWLRTAIKTPPFSATARLEVGMLLRRLQRGESIGLPLSRPMPSIGKACHELRIVDETRAWRVVYHIHSEAIVILYVFAKTTQQTPKDVLALCKQRLSEFETLIDQE